MSSIRDRVYQDDDYLPRKATVDRLTKWARLPAIAPNLEIERQKLRANIVQAMRAGEEPTADMAIPYQTAIAEFDRLQIIKSESASVLQSERYELEQGKSDHSDTYFDRLSNELDRVIQDARAQAEHLNGATTAEDAIKVGNEAIDAWKTLAALAEEYREIRAIQLELLSADLEPDERKTLRENYFSLGQFANSIDVHPVWLEKRKLAATTSSVVSGEGIKYVNWMFRTMATLPGNPADWLTSVLPTDDVVGNFVWLATEAELWLPNRDHLATAAGTASKAIDPVSKFDYEPSVGQRAALASHYATTGASPTFKGLDVKVVDPGSTPRSFSKKYGHMSLADRDRAQHRERGVPIGGH